MPTGIGAPAMTEQRSAGQYRDDEWSASDDRVDTTELQYCGEQWCTSDVRVDTAEGLYANDKWSASDDRVDEVMEASGVKIGS